MKKINQISSLVNEILAKKKKEYDKYPLKNTRYIGNMYEGLAKKLVSEIFPNNVELSVVDGVIVDDEGNESEQVDCMVVTKILEKMPEQDSYKCHINDVLMIVEVKKTITNNELQRAITQTAKFTNLMPVKQKAQLLRKSYETICGKPLESPRDKIDELIFNNLVLEAYYPPRVIIAFGGLKTESGLRRAFNKIINQENYNFLYSFPQLIITEGACLVKNNGFPYYSKNHKDGFWCFYGSLKTNSLESLIRILWARLVSLELLSESSLFQSLVEENVADSISIKYEDDSFQFIEENVPTVTLKNRNSHYNWEPAELSQITTVFIGLLSMKGALDIYGNEVSDFVEVYNIDRDYLISHLISKRIITRDGNLVNLYKEGGAMVFTPSGKRHFIDTEDPRSTLYLDKILQDRKDR